jgi:hypothetical protein
VALVPLADTAASTEYRKSETWRRTNFQRRVISGKRGKRKEFSKSTKVRQFFVKGIWSWSADKLSLHPNEAGF